ncbi:hypothetical protein NDU88_007449 [Pleurodeles waltl]|uniref:Uncharacterized protein n=1 Tax=Pleurodeles waltl TaxID=8319 RepID=A0AAV7N4B3_PLEWA|nr:hypothetical protein NDU88_007449 [Pleurodeles waltl]
MECLFPEPCERDNEDIGNPDEWIPDPLPEIHGDEHESAVTGNPDIRVPEVIEIDNGIHARRSLITEDEEGEDAKEEDAEKRGRMPNPSRRTQEEEQKKPSPGDTTTGKEGQEERELRHVPGGTWLNQILGIRIPDPLPEIHGEEDASAVTGNPDIRVLEVIEIDNGLHVLCALITEDAEGEDVEEDDTDKRGRTPNPSRRTQEEDQKNPSPGDNTTGKEGPEEREHRHIPGGTWLNKKRKKLEIKSITHGVDAAFRSRSDRIPQVLNRSP